MSSPTYNSWRKLKERCNNPNAVQYPWYGGKGVTVCERWDSFENFLENMRERPTTDHRLCRKGDTGNYERSNCVWATKSDNAGRIV